MPTRRSFLAAGPAFAAGLAAPNILRGAPPDGKIIINIGASNSLAFGTQGIAYPGGWSATDRIKIWSATRRELEVYLPGALSDFPGYWGTEAKYAQDRSGEQPAEHLFVFKQDMTVNGTLHPNWERFDAGSYWRTMITQLVVARAHIDALGYNPVVDTMLLWEGEAQASNWPMLPALYRYNLAAMLDATRLALGAPSMRVVIARIFPSWDREGVVRQAQMEIGSLPHNAWVDTDDVTKIGDGAHSDAAGTIEVGRRMRIAEHGIIARGG